MVAICFFCFMAIFSEIPFMTIVILLVLYFLIKLKCKKDVNGSGIIGTLCLVSTIDMLVAQVGTLHPNSRPSRLRYGK